MQLNPFPTRLENLLKAEFTKTKNPLTITGLSNLTPLAAVFANKTLDFLWEKQNILVFPNKTTEKAFHDLLSFFGVQDNLFSFPSYDVSPYSGLFLNERNSAERIKWLIHAQTNPLGIFTITIDSLAQKTIPPEALQDNTLELTLNTVFDSDFIQRLKSFGYTQVPLVEDAGTYSIRGGIVDIYSSAHNYPVRLELFGDNIDSIKIFTPETQRSNQNSTPPTAYLITPAKEVIYFDGNNERALDVVQSDFKDREINNQETQNILFSLAKEQNFFGIDFLLNNFYEKLSSPLDHFLGNCNLWSYNPIDISRSHDLFKNQLLEDYKTANENVIYPKIESLFFEQNPFQNIPKNFNTINISKIHLLESSDFEKKPDIEFKTSSLKENEQWSKQFNEWQLSGNKIFICCASQSSTNRVKIFLDEKNYDFQIINDEDVLWQNYIEEASSPNIYLVKKSSVENVFLHEDKIIIINESYVTGKKFRTKKSNPQKDFQKKASILSFGDLKEGDLVVHAEHGIALYEGLEIMNISGVDSEFIKLTYKDNDKLFLPIYRLSQINKYSSPLSKESSKAALDKLGNQKWAQTKSKVKSKLKDIAADLLKLYAARESAKRPAFSLPGIDFQKFENAFPFTETIDQEKAIQSIIDDMTNEKPMDRLVCGDVGFGKTEVSMRAAFKCIEDKKQVAVLVPTTILSFQHFESFKSRFKNWPINIKAINRFLSKKEVNQTLDDLKNGKIDILIGTHRLLSKDVHFKNLGLLVIDEEQKFGVVHKEKIRQLKTSIDTLAMSATPIPRTLNMSLMGIRDLSLINTAPIDRLPTRTFICKPNKEIIRKATQAEIDRGGQVFFLHNRVQSIYGVADELKSYMPDTRIKVAHGQMKDQELEKIIISFFNHEIDMLVCTTIIESGIDIPKANTMFIDKANNFGLSQLYQLRGRVGRSKSRAYCYLLLPKSGTLDQEGQNRLKIIQENTALGSGIKIAQYDLELRGTGNILGESQSGHINAVGYELYSELLEEAIRTAKGEDSKQTIEPEINIRIPAFIPDNYIKDIRSRLAYYKALSQIESPYDIDDIEDELKDQYGKIPEPTLNLMGLMLIRQICKKLCITDISTSKGANISLIALSFNDQTSLPVEEILKLTNQDNKKYTLHANSKVKIRMKQISWNAIYDELVFLERKCP